MLSHDWKGRLPHNLTISALTRLAIKEFADAIKHPAWIHPELVLEGAARPPKHVEHVEINLGAGWEIRPLDALTDIIRPAMMNFAQSTWGAHAFHRLADSGPECALHQYSGVPMRGRVANNLAIFEIGIS